MNELGGIHRRIVFEVTKSLELRLWRRTDKSGGPEACWTWQGATRNGYGAIRHQGHVLGTHVVSWVIHNGKIPTVEIVTHQCDNRPCVNPNHLRLGTFRQNVLEMIERRKVRAPRGEEVANAVLTDRVVLQIIELEKAVPEGQPNLQGAWLEGINSARCAVRKELESHYRSHRLPRAVRS